MILDLIHNVALLVALAVGLQLLARRLLRNPVVYHLAAGVLFGLVCIAGMKTPVIFAPGIIFDARTIILSIAGLFGGPLTAVLATLSAVLYRLHLGGDGATVGAMQMISSALLGLFWRRLARHDERWLSWGALWGFGLLVNAVAMILLLWLPDGRGRDFLRELGPAIMVSFPLGFLLVATLFLEVDRRRRAEHRLAASEAVQRAIVACSPLALYSIDAEGRVLSWNESAERMFGWSLREVLGQPLPIVPPDRQEEFQALMERVKAGESLTGVELERVCRDGSRIVGNLAVAPLLDGRGGFIGVLGAMEDITARWRNQELLREREERYRNLFENNHVAMLLIDPSDGRIVDANPAAVEFYGWSRQTLVGMNIMQINLLSEREIVEEMQRAENTDHRRFIFRHRLADGSIRDVEVFSGPMRVDEKDLLYSIIHDITEQTRAQAAELENRERFYELLEGAPDAVFVQAAGRFAYANAAALELYGATAEQLLGSDVLDRCVPEDRSKVRQHMTLLNQDKLAVGVSEEMVLRFDGSRVPAEVSAVPTVYDGVDGAIVFARNITRRKKLQEQLAQAQKLEAVGRLAGGVAHDFNNMLQTILGYSDMLLTAMPAGHRYREELEEIRKAGLHSAELTRQLLAFARRQTVSPQSLDLNEAVSELLKMLQRLIGEDIDLLWRPSTSACPVTIDPTQLDQILANLVVNARDAIPAVGKVTIETGHAVFDEDYCRTHAEFKPGAYEMLAVSDDGEGMDAETLSRVFEPFYTTKDKDRGTGLGLSTVYGIVRQNEGFINIYSELGCGTTVRIYLPTSSLPTHAARFAASSEDAELTGSETVLLVEDEPALLKLSRQILERLGYRVLAAVGAREAIDLAGRHAGEIDILITDVVMPHMSGRELWELLRRGDDKLACLFMSGYTENVIAHHGVLDPGVHFLQKPFSTADLARKLREILDASGDSLGE